MRSTGHALAGVALATICAVGAHALASSEAQLPTPPDGSTTTVTGCLGRGEAPGTFVLTQVKWTSTSSPGKDACAHHDAPAERGRAAAPAPTAEARGAG